MGNNKIFIQIASYRDPQLVPTIEDMIAKAKNPENLVQKKLMRLLLSTNFLP